MGDPRSKRRSKRPNRKKVRLTDPVAKHKLNNRLPAGLSKAFIRELLETLPTEGFKAQYLRKELLSKYCDPTTTPAKVRRQAAITKWLATEARNAHTNVRLYTSETDFGWTSYEQLCSDVRSLVTHIIGPIVYPSILRDTGAIYTNGASTRVRRSAVAALHKLQGDMHISNSAIKHWFALASGSALADRDLINSLVPRDESVLFTVPKKTDIDRSACKEPEGNALLQRAVGLHIRQRLRLRAGLDLQDQTRNQNLARVGPSKGLATIDLSSASDSISRQLIIDMLPFDWWSLLDDLRVEAALVDGESHTLEMISSMGNGFTFELETLLFYAITRVACRRSGVRGVISVYGDDIIAPCAIVPRLIRLFHYLGFKVNPEKSFWTGPFRESCGKHYHNGFDVSPFYIRREVSTVADLILHLNHLLEWDGRGFGFFTTPELAHFHQKWSRYIPAVLRGGIDPLDPGALVTGESPRHRIVPKTVSMHNYTGLSSLVHWYMMKETTETELPIRVDPHKELKLMTQPQVPCGERTSWMPYLLIDE